MNQNPGLKQSDTDSDFYLKFTEFQRKGAGQLVPGRVPSCVGKQPGGVCLRFLLYLQNSNPSQPVFPCLYFGRKITVISVTLFHSRWMHLPGKHFLPLPINLGEKSIFSGRTSGWLPGGFHKYEIETPVEWQSIVSWHTSVFVFAKYVFHPPGKPPRMIDSQEYFGKGFGFQTCVANIRSVKPQRKVLR